MRTIKVEELAGFRDAMLELCVPLEIPEYEAIDLCGTGGDGKNTFNISTLASFVVAAAGQPVAKHGNNSVSSACGSSNLLAHFGYQFTTDKGKLKKQLDVAGICFLHAPLFHPAMKNVAPIRKDLAVKTFFNMLGPMVNPSFPKKQLVGVFSLELQRLYAYLYQQTDKHFIIVHSLDGYDEISLTGAFKIFQNEGEKILHPHQLGFEKIEPIQLYGGDTVEEAAKVFMQIIDGKGTPAQNNVVIANAAMALHCGKGWSLSHSLEAAKESLLSGKAKECFQKLLAVGS
ncbi:MAG: anthranilate phosphoribosyltransferase, partial [Flammeovirgaceae bacterium]|nr:anthranilate phosphoribosyltransferase [Flammeovirgaceae bacterium]MDW8288540.1 anthranilate phosphoribosyltransferase [Flammeovirgaceae bacterium]